MKNKEIKVGDTVGFKCDVEQYSKVYEIRNGKFGVEIKVNVTAGEYGRGLHWIRATDAWQD